MSDARPRVVGMAWYRREAYPRIREMIADAQRLPESYAVWLVSAEQVEGEITRSGVRVVRAMIEPEAFSAWCAERGKALDGAARSEYATALAEG